MDKKKILIVSRSFYPINSPRAFRTTELAKEFARQGHQVTVITPRDELIHAEFEQQFNLTIKDLGKPKWQPVELKGKGISLLARRMLRRLSDLLIHYPDLELQWLVKKALENEEEYDLLISIAVPYPIHWGVAKVRSLKKPIAKVWVADCGDPFMGQENDSFKTPFYFKYVEKWFCKKADFLTVPTHGAINAYYSEFHDKIKVIPQGFNFEEIKVENNIIGNIVPTFAYAGVFIPGRRDPSEFLEFLVNQNSDYHFHVYTNTPSLVMPYTERSEGRIILHNFLPRLELLKELNKMDFVVNFENVGSKQTPSKLIDYVIIKKPILSIKTGNLNKLTINEFLDGDYKNQLKIDNPDQFRIEKVSYKFLELAK